jgi:hypothetical protein
MEDTKCVLAMQRRRRHINETKRKHVDGSDHSVGVRAFRQRENSNTRHER